MCGLNRPPFTTAATKLRKHTQPINSIVFFVVVGASKAILIIIAYWIFRRRLSANRAEFVQYGNQR